MPGGISYEQEQKRKKFVSLMVKIIGTASLQEGYGCISKETLSFIVQEYIRKYNPPARPGKRFKAIMRLVK